MTQFNYDIIMHELHQKLFCDVWINTLNYYLILKGKYQRNSAKGVTRIDISLAGSVSAVKADMCIVKQAVFQY